MTEHNWCHGPDCHTYSTQDRIRGTKGSKVLRTRKVKVTEYNRNGGWQYFCSQGCWNDFFHKYASACRNIAPRNEPLETPIEVTKEEKESYWGHKYTDTVINKLDNVQQ